MARRAQQRGGAEGGRVLPFIFVGRLAHDKSLDELLRSFEFALGVIRREAAAAAAAARGGGAAAAAAAGDEEAPPAPVLYVAGSGALEWLVREYEARLPGSVVYLGQVAHAQVPRARRAAPRRTPRCRA